MEISFVLVALIVFFAFFTQAATGFGALVISMTLGALLYPIDVLLNWFVPLVVLLSIYLLARHHEHIDWNLFLKKILPGMGLGMIAGQAVFYSLNTEILRYALGALVVFLAGRELLRRADAPRNVPLLPWTLAAGVVHGIFATGGPVLVYALNSQSIEKAVFRSTLTLVWGVLAFVLSLSYITSGQLTTASLPQIGMLAAILPFSILLGEWAHRYINEVLFKRLINVLLVFCGVVLLLK